MGKRKPSEAVLAKKLPLLIQKYKQQKKEERIFMKRNKRLVNEIQSHKEMLKSLNDERLVLQKYVYDKKYAKAVSEGNNIALKNGLSSVLNYLHALQTKVINSWRENQRESLVGNRESSKKLAESCQRESVEEQTVSEEPVRQSRASSLQDVLSSQDSILVCKVETLNAHEVNPVLTSHCDLPESKQELSLLLSSFCRRDTIPLDKTSQPGYQESENAPLGGTCDPDYQESENVSLEIICETDFQESENAPLQRICKPDLLQLENEAERTSPLEEPFFGFVEDPKETVKFTEMIERLSVKFESLRNYEIAQSLTVLESNPEVTDAEATTTSIVDLELSKKFKIQQLEVSIPRLELSAYTSLNSTIEIPKKDAARGRKRVKNTQMEERNHRDTTPNSASESSNGRGMRRARNIVSYKEKPLTTKLRRS